MRKMWRRIKNEYLCNLVIPDSIRQEYLKETVRKNDFSMRIIGAIIFAAEVFNIIRVLFMSQSGLGTRNNRIYFTMYCILIAIAALWLVSRRCLREASAHSQWIAQYAATALILLWHLGLNTYDLYRDPAAGTSVLTTALLGLAIFVQVPPWCSFAQFVVSYTLFQVIMAPLLDAGSRLNLTITFVVSLTISLAHTHHTVFALRQQKKILQMNAKLQELAQLDPLTRLLNKTTVECQVEQLLHAQQQTGKTGGLTLFLLDLDTFKAINDHYGHPCGDHVLIETAEAMRQAFSDAAGLGRIGGDEFAALYDRPLTEVQAIALGRELAERLGRIQWKEQPMEVHCSVGVCICTLPHGSYQQLYAETDRMLYRAKETGKGRCCVRQLK